MTICASAMKRLGGRGKGRMNVVGGKNAVASIAGTKQRGRKGKKDEPERKHGCEPREEEAAEDDTRIPTTRRAKSDKRHGGGERSGSGHESARSANLKEQAAAQGREEKREREGRGERRNDERRSARNSVGSTKQRL